MKLEIATTFTAAAALLVGHVNAANHNDLVYRNLEGLKYPGPLHEADPSSGHNFRRELSHSFSHKSRDTTIDIAYEVVMHKNHLALGHARHVERIKCLRAEGKIVALEVQLSGTTQKDEVVAHPWWHSMAQYASVSGTCVHVNAETLEEMHAGQVPFYLSFSSLPHFDEESERMFLANVVEQSPDHCFEKVKLDLNMTPRGNLQDTVPDDRRRNLQQKQRAVLDTDLPAMFGPITEIAKQITNFAQMVPTCDLTDPNADRRRLGFWEDLWDKLENQWTDIASPTFDVDCSFNPSVNLNYDIATDKAIVERIPIGDFVDPSLPINPSATPKGAYCENCYFYAGVSFFMSLEFENFIPKRFSAGMEAGATANVDVVLDGTIKGESGIKPIVPPTEIFRFSFSLGPVPITINLGVGLSAGFEASEDTDIKFHMGTGFKASYKAQLDFLATAPQGQQWQPIVEHTPPTSYVKKPEWTLPDDIDLQFNATFSPDVVVALWGSIPIHLGLRPVIGVNVGPSAVPYYPVNETEEALATFDETCQIPFSSDWGFEIGMALGDVELPAGLGSVPDILGLDALIDTLDYVDLGSIAIVEDQPLRCKYCNGCYKEYQELIQIEAEGSQEETEEEESSGGLGTLGLMVGGGVGLVALGTGMLFLVLHRRNSSSERSHRRSHAVAVPSMFKSSSLRKTGKEMAEEGRYSENPLFMK